MGAAARRRARPCWQAYANGINSFHAQAGQALPPEFHILGARPGPWQPQDSVGWALMMALDLGGNWGNEFARLSALQRIDTRALWQLMPPYPGEAAATAVDLAALYRGLGVYRDDAARRHQDRGGDRCRFLSAADSPCRMRQPINDWARHLGDPGGKGSNNWVVAGSHTESGKPLLANDPHLGLSAPAIWYFARIKAPAPAGGKPTRRDRRHLARAAFGGAGPHGRRRLGLHQHRPGRAGPVPGADQPGQPAPVPHAPRLGRLRRRAKK